jgi:alpha-L-rhamnosidase
MKKSVLLLILTLFLYKTNAQTVEKLRCENEENPMGLEIKNPLLSWQMKSALRGAKQNAYQILVADNETELKKDNGNIWNSGMVKTDKSYNIKYEGKPLESRKKYFWKVKVWNEKNKPTLYSDIASWEMAIIEKADWSAHWIGKNSVTSNPPKSIELQKEFNLAKRATRARIYITSLGAYHLIFNGKKIGQEVFAQTLTHNANELNYQIYEISNEDLSIGVNFITATLGNAWWGSNVDWLKEKAPKNDGFCKLLFQLELEFYDGSRQTVVSDGSWKTRLSPIISNTIYGGEIYDARLEYGKDWENAAMMDETMSNVNLKYAQLSQQKSLNIIKATKITEPKKGRYVLDFGKNIIGFVHLEAEGKAEKEIEIKYSDVLTDKGMVEQTSLLNVFSSNDKNIPTDKYIFKGYGIEKWQPKFTFHSFRYIEVEGFSKKPDVNTLVAKAVFENSPFVENITNSEKVLEKIYGEKSNPKATLDDSKIIIGPTLASESKNYDTNYGQVTSQSNLQGKKYILKLSIPANTSVQVELPLEKGKTINNVKESGKSVFVKNKPSKILGISYLKTENEKAIFEVLSGNYEFTIE